MQAVSGPERKTVTFEDGWVSQPLHPTRARLQNRVLEIRQEVDRRIRFGPLLAAAVMAWLRDHRSWDGDDPEKIWWSVALTVLGDWPAAELGMLQLVCGKDGRPGLRRGRGEGRVLNDLRAAWRGTRARPAWFDPGTTGVIPIVLHYQTVADQVPYLWREVLALARASLPVLEGRSAYQLARVLGWIPNPAPACVYCGREDDLTLDHAIPLDAGGHPWGPNLVPACRQCNSKKGAQPLAEWIACQSQVFDEERVKAALETASTERPTLSAPDDAMSAP